MTILSSINKDSSGYLTINFKDKAGTLEAPTSITYRIDCITNNQEVKANTPITPAASSVELILTKAMNCIINSKNDYELRVVTVTGVYSASDEIVEEYKYNVKNLKQKT